MTLPPNPPRPIPTPPRTPGWVVGRLLGAPVIISPSWFLIAVILTMIFAPTVGLIAPELGSRVYLVSGAFAILLLASVLAHEVAHALVARARGHRVTELALTMWGGHTSYLSGSVKAADGLLIAVAGPLTNLALAVGFWFAYLGIQGSVPATLAYAAASANAFVGVFNLLPGLPLDGGAILESIVWAVTGSRARGTTVAGWVGRVVAVGLMGWALAWPIAAGARPNLTTVMWSAFIAYFLWSGATAAIATGRARAAVASLSVRSLVAPAVAVSARATVALAGSAVAAAGGPHVLAILVDDAGAPVACIDPVAAASVPLPDAAHTPVAAVAVPLAHPGPAGSGIDIDLAGPAMLSALAGIGPNSPPFIAVTQSGRVVGALEVRKVIQALQAARR